MTLSNFTSFGFILYFIFYFILFYFILFYFILFYFILFYFILFFFSKFYSILFYSILFYSILFYSILFYSILFHFFLVSPEQASLTFRTGWFGFKITDFSVSRPASHFLVYAIGLYLVRISRTVKARSLQEVLLQAPWSKHLGVSGIACRRYARGLWHFGHKPAGLDFERHGFFFFFFFLIWTQKKCNTFLHVHSLACTASE